MDNRHRTETDERKRLEKLIAGQTRGRYITDSDINHTLKNPMKLKLLILVGIWIVFLVYYAYLNFSNPPSYTYNFNPISKIILRVKADDYMEEHHPEFEENMTIDMNTGIIKHKNGYMVTCEDAHNHINKVVVYFDKSFKVQYDVPQIKQDK